MREVTHCTDFNEAPKGSMYVKGRGEQTGNLQITAI
jgi:hypothetical protein